MSFFQDKQAPGICHQQSLWETLNLDRADTLISSQSAFRCSTNCLLVGIFRWEIILKNKIEWQSLNCFVDYVIYITGKMVNKIFWPVYLFYCWTSMNGFEHNCANADISRNLWSTQCRTSSSLSSCQYEMGKSVILINSSSLSHTKYLQSSRKYHSSLL